MSATAAVEFLAGFSILRTLEATVTIARPSIIKLQPTIFTSQHRWLVHNILGENVEILSWSNLRYFMLRCTFLCRRNQIKRNNISNFIQKLYIYILKVHTLIKNIKPTNFNGLLP
jgi:hypothetical protein